MEPDADGATLAPVSRGVVEGFCCWEAVCQRKSCKPNLTALEAPRAALGSDQPWLTMITVTLQSHSTGTIETRNKRRQRVVEGSGV
jgi:hypothetical protein